MTIYEGNFLTKPKMRPLVNPAPGGPAHVQIWNTEEKGSDVNLATYLIRDAWQDLFDVAVVLSQDTDLNEPVRIVRDEIKRSIGVVVLDGKAPGKLATFGSFVRHITPADLAAAQFPDRVPFGKRGKSAERPIEWRWSSPPFQTVRGDATIMLFAGDESTTMRQAYDPALPRRVSSKTLSAH